MNKDVVARDFDFVCATQIFVLNHESNIMYCSIQPCIGLYPYLSHVPFYTAFFYLARNMGNKTHDFAMKRQLRSALAAILLMAFLSHMRCCLGFMRCPNNIVIVVDYVLVTQSKVVYKCK